MDGEYFDALARRLATLYPRRTIVRTIAGVAGGLLGAVRVAPGDAAAKRGPGRTCRETANCVEDAE
jgi:hypothetical protein